MIEDRDEIIMERRMIRVYKRYWNQESSGIINRDNRAIIHDMALSPQTFYFEFLNVLRIYGLIQKEHKSNQRTKLLHSRPFFCC